jgi:hypothetical protein
MHRAGLIGTIVMSIAVFAAAALLSAAPLESRAHVLFIGTPELGRTTLTQSEQVRDALSLPWLHKGVAPLSPRWFQRCPRAGNLDAIEACVRPIWLDRARSQGVHVIIVIAERRDGRTMKWRCLGATSHHEAVLQISSPLTGASRKAASRCLGAANIDSPATAR